MKAKAALYFLILRPQLLSLERYRRKKGLLPNLGRFTVYVFPGIRIVYQLLQRSVTLKSEDDGFH
jgi:hypothetical protein